MSTANQRSGAIAKSVIKRDKYCQKCGATDGLCSHHIVAVSVGGEDTEENQVALCHSCHVEWHTFAEGLDDDFEGWLDMPPYRLLYRMVGVYFSRYGTFDAECFGDFVSWWRKQKQMDVTLPPGLLSRRDDAS